MRLHPRIVGTRYVWTLFDIIFVISRDKNPLDMVFSAFFSECSKILVGEVTTQGCGHKVCVEHFLTSYS